MVVFHRVSFLAAAFQIVGVALTRGAGDGRQLAGLQAGGPEWDERAKHGVRRVVPTLTRRDAGLASGP
jgi:hypothetical protein